MPHHQHQQVLLRQQHLPLQMHLLLPLQLLQQLEQCQLGCLVLTRQQALMGNPCIHR